MRKLLFQGFLTGFAIAFACLHGYANHISAFTYAPLDEFTIEAKLSAENKNQALITSTGESYAGDIVPITYQGLKFHVINESEKLLSVDGLQDDGLTYVVIPTKVPVESESGEEIIYTVTQISDEAFKGNKDLFKIDFANTITHIGNSAFEECLILNFEELPDNLISIGDYTFKGCDAITRIKLPASTSTLGDGCFSEMSNLKRAILFSEVKELPDYIFMGDENLDEVYLPESLKKIGDRAFFEALSLEEITLPPNLEEIGSLSFHGAAGDRKGLKHVVLPPSVKTIGERAFSSADLYTADLGNLEVIPVNAFVNCYDLKEIIFPQNLRSIEKGAFSSCGANAGRSMSNLVLPETLVSLAEDAFEGSNILSLSIGNLVTDLPSGSCGIPRILKLGSGIKTIDRNAFNPSSLSLIFLMTEIPPTVEGGFPLTAQQQRQITVVVPSEETKILYKAHEYWKDFNIVVLENSTVEVHLEGNIDIANAIYEKSGVMPSEVTNLTVTGHLTEHDFAIIRDNMLSLIYLDMGGVDNTEIPENALLNKESIETVVLPKGLIRIDEGAFAGCSSMEIEELPNGIEYIGTNAFANCQRISISKMPDALTTLGYAAFVDCVSLKTLTFGENLEYLNGVSFSSCDNLEYVDMSKATKLKDLSFNTFYLNYALHTLILPESIENIGYRAITCTALKTLELPGSLKTLEEEALAFNPLKVISFGEGITEIPTRALADNPNLLTVNFPSTLRKVSDDTFERNTKVSAISCLAIKAPDASATTFEDIDTRTCILSVPSTSFESYLSAIGWGMFSNIRNILEIDVPGDVDITTVPEEDYQDMVEQIESEQRVEDNWNILDKSNIESTDILKVYKKEAILKARSQNQDIIRGLLFCKLKHGTVMASENKEDSKGMRVFFHPKAELTSIKINNEELIDKIDSHNSIVIPLGTSGSLVVNGGNKSSKIKDTVIENTTKSTNVYDLTGRCLLINATPEQVNNLKPGIYIYNGKKILVK